MNGEGVPVDRRQRGRPKVSRGSRFLVTGCAGFIGSHLSERLTGLGYDVLGVDCFTDYYDPDIKAANLARLRDEPRFTHVGLDLSRDDLSEAFEGVNGVFHVAGQPGVRSSFGERFRDYLRHNVLATQRLLEEAVGRPLVTFAYASSSSVYGTAPAYPTAETTPRRPQSPYGMTKVATEELAGVYQRTFGVPTVGLRYFTAYGPRQRPDMAFARFLARALAGLPLPIYGDGLQVRDFTYVHDVVAGTVAAGLRGVPGRIYNIGGGRPVALRDALKLMEELVGRPLELEHHPAPPGEPRRTGCDGTLALAELGYRPRVGLRDGLAAQVEWTRSQARKHAAVKAGG